jgi:uncharacterized membrane protein YheB (UPF0754 family)
MDFFKTWIIPPLMGAIIGYFTNWLAIKMLFRPYKEIWIAGIHLPFTPGILPREKKKLAVSLGDTVSKELLTPQVIAKRIRSPELRTTAQSAVRIALESVLAQDMGKILGIPGEQAGSPNEASSISSQLVNSLRQLVVSADIQASAHAILADFLEGFREQKLGSLISREQFIVLLRDIENVLQKPLSQENSSSNQGTHARELLHAIIQMPPDETISVLVHSIVPRAYEIVKPHIGEFLRSQEFKSKLEGEASAFTKRALDRLGPMQRLFISLARYDEKIAQSLPETVDDLIATIEHILQDPDAPQKLSEAIRKFIIEKRNQGSIERVTSTEADIFSTVVQSLSGASLELEQRAQAQYEKLKNLTLREIVDLPIPSHEISSLVISAFVQVMKRNEGSTAGNLSELFIHALREAARGKTIAVFLGIRNIDIAKISETLGDALIELLESRMPALVEAIDFKSMVSERIDSFEMKEAERIVLQVAKKELSWITWLGGILGAIIGIIQSVISIL